MSFWSCYLCSAINEVTQWMRELALVPLLPLLGFGPWHLDDITSAKQQQLYKNLFESNLNTDASIGLYRYSATYTSVALGFPLLRGHHHPEWSYPPTANANSWPYSGKPNSAKRRASSTCDATDVPICTVCTFTCSVKRTNFTMVSGLIDQK